MQIEKYVSINFSLPSRCAITYLDISFKKFINMCCIATINKLIINFQNGLQNLHWYRENGIRYPHRCGHINLSPVAIISVIF